MDEHADAGHEQQPYRRQRIQQESCLDLELRESARVELPERAAGLLKRVCISDEAMMEFDQHLVDSLTQLNDLLDHFVFGPFDIHFEQVDAFVSQLLDNS